MNDMKKEKLKIAIYLKVLERKIKLIYPYIVLEDYDILYYNNSLTKNGFYRRRKNEVSLNFSEFVIKNNDFDTYKELLIHEFCHYVQHILYKRSKPHGNEWKALMRKMGSMNISVKTKYNLGTDIKKIGHFAKCDCQSHVLTTRKKNYILKGINYTCVKCHARLILVE